ncbi:MAG: hypothetical protein LQ350_004122 [Teloschistes chrysophthalmus]|nr:MAG: hypothetical protein LQ350_004122 [Niorma chrysophthalma]
MHSVTISTYVDPPIISSKTRVDVETKIQLSNYSDMFYCLTVLFVKLSILLLITRIFLAVRRNILFWLTQALIWVNTLFYAIAFFLNIFGCRPRRKIWNPDEPGQCFDTNACICSIVRIFYQIKLTETKDFTYVHRETGLLCYAEVACGLICACLPILPLVWHHLSRSTGGGDVALGPINYHHNARSTQCSHCGHYTKQSSTLRNWSDAAGDAHEHEVVKGKNWMRLEDGTIAPVPKAFHSDRAASDEQALTAAIAGV